ncbi:alanine--tRNA ligase [Flexistipes sinusarabici]|uniref:alanine--tRNA ligase n=1 Tax=Flexistipes sinusarabici TaxID=2352 RepID=UPI002357C82A|nr:alanine--tRNA ligase [Flexistipes sinusarabici]
MTGKEIRQKFLDFFEQKDHTIVKSSSLVPENDPTLLFTNAGMNQFKDTFLGVEKRNYSRAATCQKVVRAGGKHNDLENVGRTARHHTFFEMLGNFSFGDYFKRGVINYAWEFLTEVLGLDKEKLYISVFHKDDEAFNIWKNEIGIPEERISKLGEKENFWSMGDTGPCGPCSEIHIDQGPKIGCGRSDCDPECDCDRFLELWNLVFMQYDRDAEGTLHPLPKPSIDTGMGLERIAAVVQNVTSNFDTDLIRPIIEETSSIAGIRYKDNEKFDISLRVIADHARATTFLISDGVIPANEGRGYVLKRIMRRAMRHGRLIGIKENFFYKICEFVVDFMSDHYLELVDKKNYISKIVKQEESRFKNTLTTGLKITESLIEKYKYGKYIPGKEIFTLYDTYGFPVDLLEDIAEENGFSLDMEGFKKEMSAQQEKAKRAWSGSGDTAVDERFKKLASKFRTEFDGYDKLSLESEILGIISKGNNTEEAKQGDKIEIILSKTPFYPEGGGETGDKGYIKSDNAVAEVKDTKKYAESLIVHEAEILNGTLKVGEIITAEVNSEFRKAVEKNHTSTHLIHKALREVLGDHVRQSGSLVDSEKLRFDFTHFSPLSREEIVEIENIVNKKIQENLPVKKEITDIDSAIQKGAMAIFGEKYGDTVRVVSVNDFSKELCGGCHVDNTGEIGLFKITTETSVASGIRRIEALTGIKAFEELSKIYRMAEDTAGLLKTSISKLFESVDSQNKKVKELEKRLKELKDKLNSRQTEKLLENVKEKKGIKILTLRADEQDINSLRNMTDVAKAKLKSGIVVIGSENKGKAVFICGVTKDLTDRYKAGDIVKKVAAVCGGSGGGKAEMAQAGAKDINKIDEALETVYNIL